MQGDVEGKGSVRPAWLGFAVHVYNSIAAWGDLLVARPRTFRYDQPQDRVQPVQPFKMFRSPYQVSQEMLWPSVS